MKLTKNIILILAVCAAGQLHAQHVTIAPGPWNLGSTWNLGSVPNSTSGTVTINHAVNIPSGFSVSVDEVTVNSTLTIGAGGILTLSEGAGVDLTMTAGSSLIVNGEFIRNNLSTINQDAASTASFNAASIYRHRYTTTEGIPLLATWNTNSTFQVEGFINTLLLDLTSPAWNQSYGNFIYNCTGQRSIVSFNGLVRNIQGNLSFLSTGNNLTRLTDDELNTTITIGGNFNIIGTSRVNFSESGTGGIINLAGNFNFSSASSLGSFLTNTGSSTLNIAGNFVMSANTGRIFMAGPAGATGTSTINLFQNFTLASGQISESGSGGANGTIRFVGTGNFTFVNTGTIINRINYFIASTVVLDLSIYAIAAGTSGSFTLDGTIICGSLEPTGAIRNSTTLGNIRTYFPLRVYSPGSTVIYRSTSAQFMGDGQPSQAGMTTIIDNNQGVKLYQLDVGAITIGGLLQLENGMLFIGARSLNLNGTINYTSGTLGGNSNSALGIGGSMGGSLGSLIFNASNRTLGTLTLNRSGIGASVDLNSTLNVVSQLNLISGIFNNISGLTVLNGCVVTRYGTATLNGARLAVVNPGDFYDLTYRTLSAVGNSLTFSTGLELPLPTDATSLNNLTLSTNQATDLIQLTQDVIINGNVTLSRGNISASSFTITMQGNNWADNLGNFLPDNSLVIFDGITTVSGTSDVILGNIQLNSGMSLNITRDASISGNIDLRATSVFNANTTTITVNGGGLQTISTNNSNFFNLTVTKTGGSDVQLTTGLNLVGILRFNAPTTNCLFQSNGFLTLLSTSDAPGNTSAPGTAQIYRLGSGNLITGNVTVQRYMSGEGRIYRYLSSPVSNATVASWKDDFPITGAFTDRSPRTTICGETVSSTKPSLFYYNESVAGNADAGYVAYPASGLSSASPLLVGRGYAAFIRECTNPTVVDVTGTVIQGLFTFNVTYTDTGDPTADGYNLIGNPYPCTIDWDAGWTKTRISPVISMTDNGNAGVMLYWDGSAGGITNGQIAPGQAFWVRATAANPILRTSESSKVITPNTSAEFFRQPSSIPHDHITISLTNGIVKDRAFIKLRSESVNTLDDWDAPKLNNDVFDLYTLSEEQIPMAINSRKAVDKTYVIQVGIKDLENGSYTLALDEFVGEFAGYDYLLIDKYKQRSIIFEKPYKFDVDGNPLSSVHDRFLIKLSDKKETIIANEDDNMVYPNPVDRFLYINSSELTSDNISIIDNIGKAKSPKVQRVEDHFEVDLDNYSSGIYYLNLRKNGIDKIYKIVKK